jgi:hypothetical protein
MSGPRPGLKVLAAGHDDDEGGWLRDAELRGDRGAPRRPGGLPCRAMPSASETFRPEPEVPRSAAHDIGGGAHVLRGGGPTPGPDAAPERQAGSSRRGGPRPSTSRGRRPIASIPLVYVSPHNFKHLQRKGRAWRTVTPVCPGSNASASSPPRPPPSSWRWTACPTTSRAGPVGTTRARPSPYARGTCYASTTPPPPRAPRWLSGSPPRHRGRLHVPPARL